MDRLPLTGKQVLLGILVVILPGLVPSPVLAKHTLRLATLTPNGSSWMKEFQRLSSGVKARSKGQLELRFYGGAIMGDERDTVQKMDQGRLQGAAVTAVGLGMLVPAARIMELPLLFENTEEVDVVRRALTDEFAARFKRRGYILLGWGDLGWIRIFSTRRFASLADLQRAKIWLWTDDPMAKAMIQKYGLKGIPLGIQDVLPSLQTGLIEACYGSSYTTLALQWHTKVRYVSRELLTYAVAALVVTRRSFDALPPRLQQVLLAESKSMSDRFIRISRADNDRADAQLKQQGIQEVSIPKDILSMLRQRSQSLWWDLAGKMYPAELLKRAIAVRDALRRGSK
jgi:TRAP-type transport system periplasmic protein